MSELTVAASGVRALMEFAVSRGANRCALTERSRIDPAEKWDTRSPMKPWPAERA